MLKSISFSKRSVSLSQWAFATFPSAKFRENETKRNAYRGVPLKETSEGTQGNVGYAVYLNMILSRSSRATTFPSKIPSLAFPFAPFTTPTDATCEYAIRFFDGTVRLNKLNTFLYFLFVFFKMHLHERVPLFFFFFNIFCTF